VSETDSFVQEVSDELRRDRLFALFRRYGPYVVALLVAIVAYSAWNEWQEHRRLAEIEAAGDALRAAMRAPTTEARLAAIEALPGAGRESVAARFLAASTLAEAGRAEEAAAAFRAIAETDGIDPIYRDAARLRQILAGGAALPPGDRVAMLDPMAGPDAPFRLLALELRALARIDAGEPERAVEDLKAIMTDPLATTALRQRTTLLLTALGSAPAPEPATMPELVTDG
jgi:hypothetical protein